MGAINRFLRDYEKENTMEEDQDTWGVWDTKAETWVEDYYEVNGTPHKRQYINENHAYNAANKSNRNLGYYRFEARDMEMQKSELPEDPKTPNIQEEIEKRQTEIDRLYEEINALRLAQSILSGARS